MLQVPRLINYTVYQTYLHVSKTTSLALRGSGIGFKLLPVEIRQELNRPMPLRRLFAVANDCSKGYHCSFQTIWCSQYVQTLQPLRAFFTARENRIAKNHILSTTCQPPFFLMVNHYQDAGVHPRIGLTSFYQKCKTYPLVN